MKHRILNPAARLLALLLIATWNALPASATSVSIDPASLTVTVGQTFSVNIKIAGVSDLYAYQFDLGFDNSLFRANSIAEGAFLAAGGATLFIDGTIDNPGGTITYTMGSLQGITLGVNGNGILATASFTALAKGVGSINLFNPVLLDSSVAMGEIAVDSIQNASVTAVPIPAAGWLFGSALAGLALRVRRSRGEPGCITCSTGPW